ncbi:FtsW/RodA/SpoVE family cell cycle protein [Desulfoscipio gibsoniae]|uniref:Bacterial cell division membrane protein n=1 Tax=Desulfoscipio gibsoniae DSM 7213 TaxID=767817 RepID=R4KRK0_9FIRM|nr:FtsW/RodA/SpoVE family cell cycle protein [Desulfoscipio gibsoniae]AGL02236.1 bacterial cell division membrane protein [Desulfoscipio gibsoniae DSM 7213]
MHGRGIERKLLAVAFLYTLTGGLILYLNEPGPDGLWAMAASLIMFVGFMLLSMLWQSRKANFDMYITPLISFLAGTGVVFLFRLNPGYGYRQLSWVVIGLVTLFLTTTFLRRYRDLADYKYLVALAGILALLLPIFFGIELGGAKSWLDLGLFHFQPSEFVKLLLVFFLGSYLMESRMLLQAGEQRVYFLPGVQQWGPLLGMWLTALMVLVFQKDLGTALIYFGTFLAMVYMATARWLYILLGTLMFLAGAVAAYMVVSHVHTRVAIWLNPWSTAQSSGYQIIQSLYAINDGGIWGAGLGAGFPGFIPAVHTDFIFAAICEETGLLGGIGVMILFMLLVYRGFKIALVARDEYAGLMAAGFTAILGLQVFIIIAGVTKLLPMTGITLPFISYGGSSMVANFILAGMLLNISGEANKL